MGSLPELLVQRELVRRGLVPGLDFVYQASILGGRQQRGGFLLDFLFRNPPNLAINVQGEYYHYSQTRTIVEDQLLRAIMAGRGVTLIFVDESAVIRDVRGIVGDALNFIDKSKLG